MVVNDPRTLDGTITWSLPPRAVRAGDMVKEPPRVKEQAYLRPLQCRTLFCSSIVPEVP